MRNYNQSISILIVDDSRFFREQTRELIKNSKLTRRIHEATNGLEAIMTYKTYRPTIILMDVFMPKLDGIKTTKYIMETNPKAKIIMVSHKDNKEHVHDAIKFGACDFLPKPFDSSQLLVTISRTLNRK